VLVVVVLVIVVMVVVVVIVINVFFTINVSSTYYIITIYFPVKLNGKILLKTILLKSVTEKHIKIVTFLCSITKGEKR
jgi:hypothetical protein